jgi:thiol-disulfide isomerase/thioredoxin
MNRFRAFAFSLALSVPIASLAAAPKPGAPAPGFELPGLLDGQKATSLKSLAGGVVVIDFWASWCPPCAKTLPHLGKMRGKHPGLTVLAVTIDDDRKKALDFLGTKDNSLVYLHDSKHAVAEAYDLGGMPSLLIVDRKGVLRYRHDGYTEADLKKIEAEVSALMGET